MDEAEILETTYYDVMNVYRPFKTVLPETGETVFKKGLDGQKIYENVSCALSSFGGGKPQRKTPVVNVQSDYKLFYNPRYRIEKNDTIECFSCGRKFILTAGKERAFSSHCELPVNEVEKNS